MTGSHNRLQEAIECEIKGDYNELFDDASTSRLKCFACGLQLSMNNVQGAGNEERGDAEMVRGQGTPAGIPSA